MTSIARKVLRSEHPVVNFYRGLTPNLVGGAASWALFFSTKSNTELFLATLKTNPASISASAQAQLNPADYFISATVAGGFTQLITNPIWVIKTRMISTNRSDPGAIQNIWHGVARVLREEGPFGFYKGLSMSLFGVSQGAVQFAFYDPIKNFYLARQRHAQQTHPDGGDGKAEKLDVQTTLVISTTAKVIAQASVYPYQVVRARLQTENAAVRFGKGVRGVARRMWLEEGFLGFYKGLGTATLRMLPSTWTTFLVYENVKYYLPRYVMGGEEENLA